MLSKLFVGAALTAVIALAGVVPAATAETSASVRSKPSATFERDRQAILGMVGDFKVRFDFRETASFVAGYKPIDPKVSGGYESVRVVEEKPGLISLQHILVVGEGKDAALVKHWRQDWVYQPTTVLNYVRSGEWKLTPVAAADRAGAWSQTVWQTDDSPRYGGVGHWVYDGGVARWTSDATLRPLARRDAVRHPVYDSYAGVNRHAITPTGWVHEQDNAKMGLKDGKRVTFVHETVLNTYTRTTEFSAKPADDYWAKTKDYWAAVRATWNAAITRDKGVRVTEEAENGSVTGPRLMDLADDIADGKITTDKAIADARQTINSPARFAAK
jgi:hypothetical protein